ncbi:LCP family glycopolymer transferase [Faecalimonas sp.]
MKKKGMSPKERREYERLQERKKRQMEKRYAKSMGWDNPAKSVSEKGRVPNPDKKQEKKGRNILGKILLFLQVLASAGFVGMLILSNIIPLKYVIVAIICLLILWSIGLVSQVKRKKRGIVGKLYIVLVTGCLVAGTYQLGFMTGTLDKITGGNSKVDTMVVAVLANDKAEDIADVREYTFGVQYKLDKADVKDMVSHINKELDTKIKTKEYKNVNEQAKALHEGEVKAIIYNEGYKEILEEEFHGYSNKVKIIYHYNIKTKLDDVSSNIKVKTEPFNVYVSGIDVYGEISKNSRSDVNIIATVNPKTRQILLVTTPRDYYVEIPGVSHGQRDKLTHAGIYGVDTSIKTLSELYDTEIPFYARVNFTSLIDIVDELGGVDVMSDYAFKTGTAAGAVVRVSKGMNHFNGKQALAFSRERHNLPDGDNQRGKHQQAVLTAMIKKLVSPSMLIKANSIINKVSDGVETNMSQGQLQTLIKMQLNQGGSWNIKSVAAEGTGDKQRCYSSGSMRLYVCQPDEESVTEIKQLIKQVENGETLQESEMTQ